MMQHCGPVTIQALKIWNPGYTRIYDDVDVFVFFIYFYIIHKWIDFLNFITIRLLPPSHRKCFQRSQPCDMVTKEQMLKIVWEF